MVDRSGEPGLGDPGLGDAGLVAAARAGDPDAYGDLVARYQGHVYALAYSLVGSWAEAQDIAQETFIRVHGNLGQLRDPERFAGWLRRITFSVTMNWLRAYRPGRFEQLDGHVDLERLEIPTFEPGPREALERRELADAVLRALDSLPARYRVPLTMFHLDGLSYQKVADFLDIPLGTAKSLIHRARAKLRPALGEFADQEVTPMMMEALGEHRLPGEFASRVLNGLEQARWGHGVKENSVMGALEAALTAMGEPVSYHYLMGVSGAAFRIHFHQPAWCPSSPHANCGFNCVDAAWRALHYERVAVGGPEDGEQRVPRAARALVASIDRGAPVFYAHEEESLVVGYEKDGEQVLLRRYGAGERGYEPVALRELLSSWAWLAVLEKGADAPPRRDTLVRSLEIACELAHTGSYGRYASGFAAYEAWLQGLRDEARFVNSDHFEMDMVANGHSFYSLCDARECAMVYLEEIAPELGGRASTELQRAADRYREIHSILTAGCPTELAPMPWTLGSGGRWQQTQRSQQADLLERARDLERDAIEAIEAALAAL